MAGFRAYFDFSKIETNPTQGDVLDLSAEESRHLCASLRAQCGDALDVFDLDGNVYSCKLKEASPKRASVEILERKSIYEPKVKIYAAQCLPKGGVFDDILRQAVELGASGIIPLISQRSQIKLDKEDAQKKMSKWRAHIIEAIKQSANFARFELREAQTLKAFLEKSDEFDFKITASLEDGSQAILERLENSPPNIKSLCILTGPEGDLSKEEYANAANAGFKPVRLGANVMKCDTASACSISITEAYFNAQS